MSRLSPDDRELLYGTMSKAPSFVVRRVNGDLTSSFSPYSTMSRSMPALGTSFNHDLLFDDHPSDDDGVTDVSKRHGFMRVQARPPTVLAGISFLNNTHEEGLKVRRKEDEPLPIVLKHRYTKKGRIARLKRSIALTSERLNNEQRKLHGKMANRGLEIVDRMILHDLSAKRGEHGEPSGVANGGSGEDKQDDAWNLALYMSEPPNKIEVKLMQAQGVLKQLKRQQKKFSPMQSALQVDIKRVEAEIEAYRRELHSMPIRRSDGKEDDKLSSLMQNLSSLRPGGGAKKNQDSSKSVQKVLTSGSPYEGTDLLRFAREKQWSGPLTTRRRKEEIRSKDVPTPSTSSLKSRDRKSTPGVVGILRCPSTAGSRSPSRMGSSVGGSQKRITWSPVKSEMRYGDGHEIAVFDRIPNTAEMGIRTLTRRTEFRKTMGRQTGKELKKKQARRRLSNAAASARAIARIRLAAKRAKEREAAKKERVRRASLGFAGPAPRPGVLARYKK